MVFHSTVRLSSSLQIFNTTHKKAVKDDSIKEFMDTSGIQKLINNGDYVICIGSRSNQNQDEFNTTKVKRCKSCMFRLPTADFQFCSIHCKVGRIQPILWCQIFILMWFTLNCAFSTNYAWCCNNYIFLWLM